VRDEKKRKNLSVDHNQIYQIRNKTSNLGFSSGSAVYTAIIYCEKHIVEFVKTYKNIQWKAFLHVFTDGEDNSSDSMRKFELEEQIKYMKTSPHYNVQHSFVYSFNSNPDFQAIKSVAETIGAAVVLVDVTKVEYSIEERNKLVFNCVRDEKKRKNLSVDHGYAYIKGDTPSVQTLLKQLQKAEKVFSGSFIETEGIFRESGSVISVAASAEHISSGSDSLEDYNDPINAAHAFKNVLKKYDSIIPKETQWELFTTIRENPGGTVAIRQLIFDPTKIPEANRQCLQLIFSILFRVSNAQKNLGPKGMGAEALGRVFATIILPAICDDSGTLQDVAKKNCRGCKSCSIYYRK